MAELNNNSNDELQLVTFLLEGETFACNVMAVREIISMTEITPSPDSPAAVRGLINLRGTVVPVVSLRRLFNKSDSLDESLASIAIMDIKGSLTGLIIDGVSDVIRIKKNAIGPAQPGIAWNSGVLQIEERLVLLLRPEVLLAGIINSMTNKE